MSPMTMIGRMDGVDLGGGMVLALGGMVDPVVGVAEVAVDTIVMVMELEDTEDLVIGLDQGVVMDQGVVEVVDLDLVAVDLEVVDLVIVRKDLEMHPAACPPSVSAMAYIQYKLLHSLLVYYLM